MESSSETISDGILKSTNALVVVKIRVHEYLLVYMVVSPIWKARGAVNNSFEYNAFNFFSSFFFCVIRDFDARNAKVLRSFYGMFNRSKRII